MPEPDVVLVGDLWRDTARLNRRVAGFVKALRTALCRLSFTALFIEVRPWKSKTLAKPDWQREVRDLYGVRGAGCPCVSNKK